MPQQPAEAFDGTPPGLDDYLEQLQTNRVSVERPINFDMTYRWGEGGHYVRLSYKKYEVTNRIGSAIIVDIHFRAARLYSGLDGSTSRFGSAAGSAGFGAWAA